MKTGDILKGINDAYLQQFPFLAIDRIYTEKDMTEYKLATIDAYKCVYTDNLRMSNDVALGQTYTHIFSYRNPAHFMEVEAQVDWLALKITDTNNRMVIPRGYGGCVRLKFEAGIPGIVQQLPKGRYTPVDLTEKDILLFVTREIKEQMLERWAKM
jgi:hypothetical protein